MTYEFAPTPTTPIASGSEPQAQNSAEPAKARFNSLAVVSFALSLMSALGLPAVIIGHFAIADLKKTGERGRVLAILALVFGYISIAGAIFFSVVFFATLAEGIHRFQQDFPEWQTQLDQFNQLQNS
jgi:nitrogen fixation/metabolism regulation signal transduction histidine kinase